MKIRKEEFAKKISDPTNDEALRIYKNIINVKSLKI